ncbi:MAG TPA: NAD(P)-binding domain-containing protein [Casimicrobiaceae bacterium]|nr:NAD(P)-binding domain-containing protein [Casimicrobiaceae bacterium]
MKVGVIGSGDVGQVLASGFVKHGHEVTIGTRDPSKLASWVKANPGARIGTFAEVAKFAELVVLAVKGSVALEALDLAGVRALAGKVVIDATNPIGGPPHNGVLEFFTGLDDSLMERLQKRFPETKFVKAFNSVGNARMVNPDFGGVRPTMFICGNDAQAKATVTRVLDRFGWEVEDMGGVESARAIEPLCMLWCIPGFLRNQWTHAFKLLK